MIAFHTSFRLIQNRKDSLQYTFTWKWVTFVAPMALLNQNNNMSWKQITYCPIRNKYMIDTCVEK